MYCPGTSPTRFVGQTAKWSRILYPITYTMQRSPEKPTWFLRAHTCGQCTEKDHPQTEKTNLISGEKRDPHWEKG